MDACAALMREMSLASCHLCEGDIFDCSRASLWPYLTAFLCKQTLVFLVFCHARSTVAVPKCEELMSRRSLALRGMSKEVSSNLANDVDPESVYMYVAIESTSHCA